ncbi:MAG: hypothetical protein AAF127_00445 [Pseudomonadota bacterium]
MAWLFARKVEFMVWPQRGLRLTAIEERKPSANQFGLEAGAIGYSCSISSGREKSEQYFLQWGDDDELPETFFGEATISEDKRSVSLELRVPEDAFNRLFSDLLSVPAFGVEIDVSTSQPRLSFGSTSKALVDAEFRLSLERIDNE